MFRHPKIAAWEREEDGSYKRDLGGWALHVTWHPESKDPDKRRGFSWSAVSPDDVKLEGEGVDEEIETAMVHAEDAALRAGAVDAA